jgi:multidrug efflux pump subunit AcrA (membrane-fusion protein)
VAVPAPPPEEKSRRWLLWLILLAVVVAGGVYYATNRQAAKAVATAPVTFRTVPATSGTLFQTVRVTGQTSAIEFVNITAPMLRGPDANREMILMDLATPGSWVKKGQMVARIDAQSILDHIDDLNDTIESAQADIRKRGAEQQIEMENLNQTLRLSKASMDKARLEYNGSETQTDIQRQLLKLTLDEADARYKQNLQDVTDTKKSHAAELQILELTLLRHTRHRDRHKRDATAFTVYASMEGLVVMQQIWRGSEMGQVQQGDRLAPGQPFMKIVNTKKMQVEGQVNQAESSDFRIGQTARIKFDAFNGMEFDGKVHSIGALANGGYRNSYFVRNVPIRIDIGGNDPRLIPDLSASADVLIAKAENQTIIPLAALSQDGSRTVVQVKAGENWETRQVETGLRNGTQVAVTNGLKPGEVVRLNN